MDKEFETILSQIVRIGIVSSVDGDNRTVRVKFSSLNDMVSGNLPVMQRNGGGVNVAPDNRHSHTDSRGGTCSTVSAHSHTGSITGYWLPSVGDTVLCLYLPIFGGDGIVLGAI
jgi:hypothetical protein